MGCVSSHLLNQDDDFSQIGSSALGHHIVSLTSTTYGLLTLDPPTPTSEPHPEVINSWELMAGLDPTTTDSFRFSPQPSKPSPFRFLPLPLDKENSHPNHKIPTFQQNSNPTLKNPSFLKPFLLGGFEDLCPPKGENKVVLYTTSLRGVRKTFEACNAVRTVIEGHGVCVCERDISMDKGFREELRELMKGKEDRGPLVPPRVFVKGKYVGGADEMLRIVEEGCLEQLLQGLPKSKTGYMCEGCGGARFLPCFRCNGSHKMVMDLKGQQRGKSKTLVVQCVDCNENGLVRCPICS